ncbi:hypothetical protein B0H16DRAFT_1693805 [Mycena metata]|uniref:Uncharacterized protein n=1 Tax=Mycena metata TaxID=1033252 RepID=A0AAD7IHV2_9AGAR|nr:hypothetical protein B0H16DRAFT_1693805 [Mycena metata]
MCSMQKWGGSQNLGVIGRKWKSQWKVEELAKGKSAAELGHPDLGGLSKRWVVNPQTRCLPSVYTRSAPLRVGGPDPWSAKNTVVKRKEKAQTGDVPTDHRAGSTGSLHVVLPSLDSPAELMDSKARAESSYTPVSVELINLMPTPSHPLETLTGFIKSSQQK